jgi:cytochrome P450
MNAPPRIELVDPASFANGQPWEQLRWLRANDPVHWHLEPAGGRSFWALSRYEDVRAVGRDSALFSSVPTIMIPDPAPGQTLEIFGDHAMMLTLDPPRHTQYRRMISCEFTPRATRVLAPRIAELAGQIVDAVTERGRATLSPTSPASCRRTWSRSPVGWPAVAPPLGI